jgi:hypothetical protein
LSRLNAYDFRDSACAPPQPPVLATAPGIIALRLSVGAAPAVVSRARGGTKWRPTCARTCDRGAAVCVRMYTLFLRRLQAALSRRHNPRHASTHRSRCRAAGRTSGPYRGSGWSSQKADGGWRMRPFFSFFLFSRPIFFVFFTENRDFVCFSRPFFSPRRLFHPNRTRLYGPGARDIHVRRGAHGTNTHQARPQLL